MRFSHGIWSGTLVLAAALGGAASLSAADAPPAKAVGTAAAGARDPYDRSNVPIEEQPTDPSLAKIVLVAGDAGTGHGPGEHEHFAGCALFYRMLKQTPGVAPVMVQDGWPTKPETLKGAKAVVFFMDGGGKQTTIAHAAEVDQLAAAGAGIVHVHQCIDYPADFVPHAVAWLGGAYHPKTGLRGHWDKTFDPAGERAANDHSAGAHAAEHPTLRGVEPFKLVNEGYIYHLTWADGMKGVTPILKTQNPKAKAGSPPLSDADQIFCWAYDRPDGGRSFVNTGGHGHDNWGQIGFRRLMINGILWAGKVEVPAGGAKVDLDPADLNQNMDKKPPKKAAATKPATKPAAKPTAKSAPAKDSAP